jgi:hypothetical protein
LLLRLPPPPPRSRYIWVAAPFNTNNVILNFGFGDIFLSAASSQPNSYTGAVRIFHTASIGKLAIIRIIYAFMLPPAGGGGGYDDPESAMAMTKTEFDETLYFGDWCRELTKF